MAQVFSDAVTSPRRRAMKRATMLALKGLHYSDVEVGYDLPLLVQGWVQGDLLEVDEKAPGP